MNLHHLELFYYVAKHRGISRAVRHIPYGIQQPAVSSQILLLEQDLGAKLFERQPFRLTAEGQELFAFAEPFFDRTEEVAARLRQRQAPTLRIAASELILRDHLPAIIEQLRKKHPTLRFALRNGFQSQIEAWLQDGQIDLAIAPLVARPQAGLKCLPIVQLPPVLLVPKGSPVKSAADLWARPRIDEPLICLPAAEAITRVFRRGLQTIKVDWPTSIEASSTEVVTQYVANGYGLGVGVYLPHLIKHPAVRSLPLPGFEPVEIAALWRPPVSSLQEDLRHAIEARARELWPR
ncbi:MAG TPA: LysR family transcriptional regulator [Opitutus sp.]|nr:LysR family transcriptional regulator [Opitutus sp.]